MPYAPELTTVTPLPRDVAAPVSQRLGTRVVVR
jgi:hypothetical protein